MTACIAIAVMVLLGVALLVLLSGIALYARLARLKAAVKSSWSALDVKLKEHHDLAAGKGPKAEADFKQRQARSGGPRDNIRHAVRSYNSRVMDYNGEIQSFPSNIIAGLFTLKKAAYFDLEE